MNDRQSKHGYKLIWRNIEIPNNIPIPIDAETYNMSFLELNVICKKRPVFKNSTSPTCNEACNNERRWVRHWNGQMVHTHTYKNISLLFILFKRELQNYTHIFYFFWWQRKHSRFSDPDRSLNRKNERFKIFEVEPGSNRDDQGRTH